MTIPGPRPAELRDKALVQYRRLLETGELRETEPEASDPQLSFQLAQAAGGSGFLERAASQSLGIAASRAVDGLSGAPGTPVARSRPHAQAGAAQRTWQRRLPECQGDVQRRQNRAADALRPQAPTDCSFVCFRWRGASRSRRAGPAAGFAAGRQTSRHSKRRRRERQPHPKEPGDATPQRRLIDHAPRVPGANRRRPGRGRRCGRIVERRGGTRRGVRAGDRFPTGSTASRAWRSSRPATWAGRRKAGAQVVHTNVVWPYFPLHRDGGGLSEGDARRLRDLVADCRRGGVQLLPRPAALPAGRTGQEAPRLARPSRRLRRSARSSAPTRTTSARASAATTAPGATTSSTCAPSWSPTTGSTASPSTATITLRFVSVPPARQAYKQDRKRDLPAKVDLDDVAYREYLVWRGERLEDHYRRMQQRHQEGERRRGADCRGR